MASLLSFPNLPFLFLFYSIFEVYFPFSPSIYSVHPYVLIADCVETRPAVESFLHFALQQIKGVQDSKTAFVSVCGCHVPQSVINVSAAQFITYTD